MSDGSQRTGIVDVRPDPEDPTTGRFGLETFRFSDCVPSET